jgi:Tol biopolymer transport system component
MTRRTLALTVLPGTLLLSLLFYSGIRSRYQRAEAAPPPPQKLHGSIDPSMSSDGRFVTFTSGDPSLYARDVDADQILVWDRKTGRIQPASVSNSGHQGNGNSGHSAASADGRFIAFESAASDLVEGDTNNADDIFVRDQWKGVTERLSVSGSTEQANNWSSSPAISGDGRFVAFCSEATNLVAHDTNREPDVFVRDRILGTTERVSVGKLGEQADADSTSPSISADGRFVAFHSRADNLVPGDRNITPDIFVRDGKENSTIRADFSALPMPDVQAGYGFGMSPCGRFLAVMPITLVNWDLPIPADVDESLRLLLWDREANASRRIGPQDTGRRGNLHSSCCPAVSLDGRFIAFDSHAANLVPDDTNRAGDVFVVECDKGRLERVSLASSGAQGNDASMRPSISADGRFVVFASYATNLVAGDTNGHPDIFLRDRKARTTVRVGN